MSISLCNTEQKVKHFPMRFYKNESTLLTVKILWLSLRCFAPKPSSKSRDFVMASSCCDLTMPHLLWYTKADLGSLGSLGFTPFMKARKDLSRSFGFNEADTHGGRESLTAPERKTNTYSLGNIMNIVKSDAFEEYVTCSSFNSST